MHDVTVLGITAEDVGDNLTECLGEDTLVDVLDGVVHIFFCGTYAAHHITLVVHNLFVKYETNCCDEADEGGYVVPVELLSLEAHHSDDGKYTDGDDLLDDFQLHEVERTACDVRPYVVGWDEEAVFHTCDEPRKEDDLGHGPSVGDVTLLHQQVAIPGECHESV